MSLVNSQKKDVLSDKIIGSMNNFVNRRIEAFWEKRNAETAKKMENEYKELKSKNIDETELWKRMIKIGDSISQKNRVDFGLEFEKIVQDVLRILNVTFTSQAPINENGIVCSRAECSEIVDIVAGPVKQGDSITGKVVFSCKTSCRERFKQDLEWSTKFPPKLYLFIMAKGNYPPSIPFKECETRKTIACNINKKDKRIYKLNFDNLYNEIKKVLYTSTVSISELVA